MRRSWLLLLLLGCSSNEPTQPIDGPGLSGRWRVVLGPAQGGTGLCTLSDISLEVIEKANEAQPVDSLLGNYSGGQGTCPYDPGSGQQDFEVAFPLDSILYGIVDRRGADTIVDIRFGEPGRGTLGGVANGQTSMSGSVFIFVTDPAGHVTRAFFTAQRE